MDKDDLLIRELLKEEHLQKAPEDFTARVMQAIKSEQDIPRPHYAPVWIVSLWLLATGIVSVIIYFTNPGFLMNFITYFAAMAGELFSPFHMLANGFLQLEDVAFPFRGPFAGIVLAIGALLLAERLFKGKRSAAGIFV
ncbi:MAG: hypothetical protein P8100_01100 [bacterium]|jgi:hypothetical protein